MLISSAFAQSGAPPAVPGGGFIEFLPFVFILLIFYLLLIRPMSKRAKLHAEMTKSLKRGDRVVTGGGIVGTVIRAREGEPQITVEIAENMRIKVMRATIAEKLDDSDGDEGGDAGKKNNNKKGKDKQAA